MTAKSNPKWLEPLWEKKKSETAKRVEQAVTELVKQSESVTLEYPAQSQGLIRDLDLG